MVFRILPLSLLSAYRVPSRSPANTSPPSSGQNCGDHAIGRSLLPADLAGVCVERGNRSCWMAEHLDRALCEELASFELLRGRLDAGAPIVGAHTSAEWGVSKAGLFHSTPPSTPGQISIPSGVAATSWFLMRTTGVLKQQLVGSAIDDIHKTVLGSQADDLAPVPQSVEEGRCSDAVVVLVVRPNLVVPTQLSRQRVENHK